jgi:hypothetical protein
LFDVSKLADDQGGSGEDNYFMKGQYVAPETSNKPYGSNLSQKETEFLTK